MSLFKPAPPWLELRAILEGMLTRVIEVNKSFLFKVLPF
jgi:hypothetical protein